MNEHLKRAIWDRLPQNEQEVLERLIAKIEQQTKADLTVGDEIVVLSVMRHRVKQLKARGPQEGLTELLAYLEQMARHNWNNANTHTAQKYERRVLAVREVMAR